MNPEDALIEILQQINDLSGAALDALTKGKGGGGGEGGPPPGQGGPPPGGGEGPPPAPPQ